MLKFFGLVFLNVPTIALRAYVLVQLWLWFLVPFGIAPVGFMGAIGVSLLVNLLLANVQRMDWSVHAPTLGWFGNGIVSLLFSVAASLVSWGVGALAYWAS